MTAVQSKSNEINIIRIYDATVQAVWDAWTDPAQTAQWWGPRGFTLTTHSKDLRVGGHWTYTMHGPDGTDWPNSTKYHEVEPLRKLVYDHGGNEDRPPVFRVTVLFTSLDGGARTKMDMTMTLPTPEAAEQTRKFIKSAGGNGTWDRLAEYLEQQSSGKEQFVINRTFDAPLATVYEMWTNPEHFTRWLPPTGFTMRLLKADIRPGGQSFWVMQSENGDMKFHGRIEYVDFRRPLTIVYKQQFADEQGGIARHPMAPVWPETMLTTVTFAEEAPNRTRITVTWEPYGSVTSEELAAFVKEKPGMTGGWTGSFDKLEALLAKQ
jgi:uncharacterized protein YndB with AHSA1/START domain